MELGYPALSGLDEGRFRELLEPLVVLGDRHPDPVLVVTRELIALGDRVSLLRLVGAPSRAWWTGITMTSPLDQ